MLRFRCIIPGRFLLGAAALLTFTLTAMSAEVTLSFRSGDLSVTGELMAADSWSYVIKSEKYGVMALEAARFDCRGAACPKSQNAAALGIHGSNTIGARLMPNTIERFAEEQGLTVEKIILGSNAEEVGYRLMLPDGQVVANIDLRSHGTNTAPPSLAQGDAQIGMMSRPIKPEEVQAISDAGTEIKTNVFALDGVLVVVSPKNPVAALSLEQIAKIFSGEIKDWAQLGGKPGKINLYARDSKSGTYDTFNNLVLAPQNLKISPEAKRFESSPDLSDETSRDPNGIGFIGFGYRRNAKPLSISSSCGIVFQPDVFSVKTEEYPLSRRLFLQTSEHMPTAGMRLVDFALSDQAQPVITESGFVNQQIDTVSFDSQSMRLAHSLAVPDKEFSLAYMRELVNELRGAQRLSITFRFQPKSANLDEKAQQDIPRLVRYLKSLSASKHVVLVGFSDNAGTFDANRLVALKRATGIKEALKKEGVAPALLDAKAYGSLLPAGCNDTEAGREANRRVEVWIKD
jgi:phosphate transport system substrate-binding protein